LAESGKNNSSGPAAGGEGSGGRKRKDAVAVALKYELGSEHAPKVTAGGRGAIAEQILAIAFATGTRVREDADLAEMLSAIDIDSEIPIEAFAAVAEILAYVYRANGTMPDFGGEDEEPGSDGDGAIDGMDMGSTLNDDDD